MLINLTLIIIKIILFEAIDINNFLLEKTSFIYLSAVWLKKLIIVRILQRKGFTKNFPGITKNEKYVENVEFVVTIYIDDDFRALVCDLKML